ncbi:MAG: DUF4124 domain-containing protein [Burkholderiaceae bacterium]|jgi:hypothetical protein|nr:DUF4124 domain-containing protein [Burkholderiaceae bacterium]
MTAVQIIRRLSRVSLACLAAGVCTAAWAQPAPPPPNIVQAPSAAPAASAQPKPQSAPIKRWVDERGVTHYGDALPPQPMRDIQELPQAQQPSAADLARGQADLARYRQQLQPPLAPPAPTSAPAFAPAAQPSGPLTCAQQWAQYDAAYACMDPYRMAKGGIRPEAFEKCPVVKEPGCPR